MNFIYTLIFLSLKTIITNFNSVLTTSLLPPPPPSFLLLLPLPLPLSPTPPPALASGVEAGLVSLTNEDRVRRQPSKPSILGIWPWVVSEQKLLLG